MARLQLHSTLSGVQSEAIAGMPALPAGIAEPADMSSKASDIRLSGDESGRGTTCLDPPEPGHAHRTVHPLPFAAAAALRVSCLVLPTPADSNRDDSLSNAPRRA